MNDEELLIDLYYNKHNYDGLNELYVKAKRIHPTIKKDFVREWLNKQSSYQQTKQQIGEIKYLPIYSEIPYSFQIDLTFFPRYRSKNSNYEVLFTAINVNSRYAYAYYGKNKTTDTILGFMDKLYNKTPINSITCDEGGEFNNKKFIQYCNDKKIILYFVKGDSHKLGIINRFHRTIKDKLTKFFISSNSVRWIDIIDNIIKNYNNSINRGIGLRPSQVNNAIENDIINEKRLQTLRYNTEMPEIYNIGDEIRIIRKRELFSDKHLSKYTSKIYKVIEVLNNSLEVVDDKGKTYIVKKTSAQKINNVSPLLPSNEAIIESSNEERSRRKLKKSDIDLNNIVEGKRNR